MCWGGVNPVQPRASRLHTTIMLFLDWQRAGSLDPQLNGKWDLLCRTFTLILRTYMQHIDGDIYYNWVCDSVKRRNERIHFGLHWGIRSELKSKLARSGSSYNPEAYSPYLLCVSIIRREDCLFTYRFNRYPTEMGMVDGDWSNGLLLDNIAVFLPRFALLNKHGAGAHSYNAETVVTRDICIPGEARPFREQRLWFV